MASMRKSGLLLVWLLPVLAVIGIVYRAPAWLELHTLTVTLEPGQTLTLGREALWAPQADSDHLRLRRAAEGGWWLANIAPGKQVLWQSAGSHDDQPIREWPLTAGAAFTMDGCAAVRGTRGRNR
jgi:cell division protein FtsW